MKKIQMKKFLKDWWPLIAVAAFLLWKSCKNNHELMRRLKISNPGTGNGSNNGTGNGTNNGPDVTIPEQDDLNLNPSLAAGHQVQFTFTDKNRSIDLNVLDGIMTPIGSLPRQLTSGTCVKISKVDEYETSVAGMNWSKKVWIVRFWPDSGCFYAIPVEELGKTVFLTKVCK